MDSWALQVLKNYPLHDNIKLRNSEIENSITIAKFNMPLQCLENADCCILVTEWDEFKKLRPEDFTKHMHQPVLIDGRRIYDSEDFSQKLKFAAIGLGQ